jgi:hypothetical protein
VAQPPVDPNPTTPGDLHDLGRTRSSGRSGRFVGVLAAVAVIAVVAGLIATVTAAKTGDQVHHSPQISTSLPNPNNLPLMWGPFFTDRATQSDCNRQPNANAPINMHWPGTAGESVTTNKAICDYMVNASPYPEQLLNAVGVGSTMSAVNGFTYNPVTTTIGGGVESNSINAGISIPPERVAQLVTAYEHAHAVPTAGSDAWGNQYAGCDGAGMTQTTKVDGPAGSGLCLGARVPSGPWALAIDGVLQAHAECTAPTAGWIDEYNIAKTDDTQTVYGQADLLAVSVALTDADGHMHVANTFQLPGPGPAGGVSLFAIRLPAAAKVVKYTEVDGDGKTLFATASPQSCGRTGPFPTPPPAASAGQ